ncbi:MAG: MFS transporter [Propionibacteriaceae bacterium]|jgi:MFS family permease|nr:MFS transporter [Propionibacteriaceae bacterium]
MHQKEGSVPVFASLSIRNFRYFFFGGFISNIGTWMARIGQDWLVLNDLTNHSSLLLGLITALQFVPVLFLAGYAGTLADRFDKHKLLQITQTCMMAMSLTLSLLVIFGVVQLWHVFAIAFVFGIITAFDNPARQAFAPEMVPVHLIPNAVGLNTTSFNAARLIGPGVAGFMIAWWGVGPTLLVNAISFIAVIGSLAMQHTDELHAPKPVAREKGAIRAGIKYVANRPRIVLLMFTVFMLGTFGMNFQITNLLMATQVYGAGSEEFGMLGTIMAIGSLSAGLLAAKRTNPRLRLIMISMAGFGASMVVLTISPNIYVYAIALIPTGLTALTVMTAANSSVQLTTEPEMRGRVMALYMAIFMGGTPIGSPLIGWIGQVVGARATLAVGAIAAFIAVAVVLIYVARSKDWDWPRHSKTKDPDFDYIGHGATSELK